MRVNAAVRSALPTFIVAMFAGSIGVLCFDANSLYQIWLWQGGIFTLGSPSLGYAVALLFLLATKYLPKRKHWPRHFTLGVEAFAAVIYVGLSLSVFQMGEAFPKFVNDRSADLVDARVRRHEQLNQYRGAVKAYNLERLDTYLALNEQLFQEEERRGGCQSSCIQYKQNWADAKRRRDDLDSRFVALALPAEPSPVDRLDLARLREFNQRLAILNTALNAGEVAATELLQLTGDVSPIVAGSQPWAVPIKAAAAARFATIRRPQHLGPGPEGTLRTTDSPPWPTVSELLGFVVQHRWVLFMAVLLLDPFAALFWRKGDRRSQGPIAIFSFRSKFAKWLAETADAGKHCSQAVAFERAALEAVLDRASPEQPTKLRFRSERAVLRLTFTPEERSIAIALRDVVMPALEGFEHDSAEARDLAWYFVRQWGAESALVSGELPALLKHDAVFELLFAPPKSDESAARPEEASPEHVLAITMLALRKAAMTAESGTPFRLDDIERFSVEIAQAPSALLAAHLDTLVMFHQQAAKAYSHLARFDDVAAQLAALRRHIGRDHASKLKYGGELLEASVIEANAKADLLLFEGLLSGLKAALAEYGRHDGDYAMKAMSAMGHISILMGKARPAVAILESVVTDISAAERPQPTIHLLTALARVPGKQRSFWQKATHLEADLQRLPKRSPTRGPTLAFLDIAMVACVAATQPRRSAYPAGLLSFPDALPMGPEGYVDQLRTHYRLAAAASAPSDVPAGGLAERRKRLCAKLVEQIELDYRNKDLSILTALRLAMAATQCAIASGQNGGVSPPWAKALAELPEESDVGVPTRRNIHALTRELRVWFATRDRAADESWSALEPLVKRTGYLVPVRPPLTTQAAST